MIFVDTGAWVGISNRNDQHYKDALTIYRRLEQKNSPLLTTDYVIDEAVTLIRRENHSLAVGFLDRIERSEEENTLTIVEVNSVLFKEAKFFFRQYDSIELSFTDCTSFAVCRKYRTFTTFAFDQHFSMMGIALLKP